MAMSQQEYVAKKGNHCPFCGETDFTGEDADVVAGNIKQTVFCNACERSWVDLYNLVGYEEIVE